MGFRILESRGLNLLNEKDWRLGFIGFIGLLNIRQIWDYFTEGGSPHVLISLLPFLFFLYFLPSRQKK